MSGIVNNDSPLNKGKLGKENNLITQGTLDLNEESKTKYTLSFLSNVEYATSSDKVAEAEATVPPANTESWHKEDIVLTAPQGFTIAETSAPTSSLMLKNKNSTTLAWTKEGLNQTVSYTLTRTTTGKTYNHTATVSLDKTPPVLSVDADELSYTLTASDALSELKQVVVDGASLSLSNGTYSGSGTPGSHTATATDKAGNVTTVSFVLTSGPTDPPVINPDPVTFYTVTLPAIEGAATNPEAGEYDVESWSDFRFYLTLDKAYDKSLPVVTTDRGETITPRSSDNAHIIKQVRSDVQIRIDGIIKNPAPVANEKIETNHPKVWKTGNELHIQAVTDEPGYIYTPDGKLQTVCHLIAGEVETVRLPDGIYFVRVGKERFKIVL